MATIDSNGVLFYQDSDNFTPPASLNLAQSNLSDLLSAGVRFKRVANNTAKASLVASIGLANITATNPLFVWRADAPNGKQLEVTTNGTTWAVYNNVDTGDIALSLSNGFSGAIVGGWNGMTLRNVGNIVIINGLFTRATSWGAGTTIGTVPAGWAPPRREKGTGIDVLSDGSVVADAAGDAGSLVSCKSVYALS